MKRPLAQQIELIVCLAKRDLKTHYKDSLLGFFWSLLKPLFMTMIIWIVFNKIVLVPFPHELAPYWLHVLISLLVWNYFIGSLHDATNSVIANANLVKKVHIDAEVFPMAAVLANAVHLFLATTVALVLTAVTVGINRYIVFFPILIAVLTILALGISLFLAALNVFYRDVRGVLEIVTMAWFYVTPIIYPLQVAETRVGPKAFAFYMLNPVAPIMGAIRKAVLYGAGKGEIGHRVLIFYLCISTAVGLVLLLTGWLFFRKLSKRFADEL